MKRLHKPDFTRSNINVSATMADFLGAENNNATLPYLTKELQKGYKNVVYICMDGMGIYPIRQNLPRNDFLRKCIVKKLLSPFPSTTTNATTSLTTNKLPLEHGWFGWSMHFASIDRNVNIFLNTDSWTDEPVEVVNSPLSSFPHFFDQANTDYAINTVFPKYVKVTHPERNTVFYGLNEFFDAIQTVCGKDGKQFVYAYCPEPDHSMHDYGVTCEHTRKLMGEISDGLQHLAENCRDTLFVVTADHGQIDINGYVFFDKDEKLMNMLNIYPYMEARAVAFSVKDGRKEEFRKHFTQNYSKDFRLFDSDALVKKGYFGNIGDKAHLLGDFIAVGTYTHKQAIFTPTAMMFKGHHTSLTEEMEVPLIVYNTRK